jgi:hypothetical protein
MLRTFHCRYRDFSISTETHDELVAIMRFVWALIECGKIPRPCPRETEEFRIKILVNGEPFRVKGLVSVKGPDNSLKISITSIKRIKT